LSVTASGKSAVQRSRSITIYVAAAVVFVGASFVSLPALHAVSSALGASPPNAALRIYFEHPVAIDGGITSGQPVSVVVESPTSAQLTWSAKWDSNGANDFESGVVSVAPNRATVFTVTPRNTVSSSWLVITVQGVPTQLRAWVR
jgi:hypothetical protein